MGGVHLTAIAVTKKRASEVCASYRVKWMKNAPWAARTCVDGACAEPEPPADACTLEASCPEVDTDSGASMGGATAPGNPNRVADAALQMDMMRPRLDMQVAMNSDMATPRPMPLDMNTSESNDLGFFAMDGGMEGGGATGLNLSGTYSVVSKVLVVTGGMLEEEQEIRHIAKLEVLAGTRYRMQIFDLDGILQHREPSIDFSAPEGPGRYQFEYETRTPERMNCDRKDTYFERGRYEMGVFGFRLIGTEDRRSELVGDRCPSMPYIVKLETTWTALP